MSNISTIESRVLAHEGRGFEGAVLKDPLLGIGKVTETVPIEYPVLAISAEAYDFMCNLNTQDSLQKGRYKSDTGFVIRVGGATEDENVSYYDHHCYPILVLKSEFRGARVICKFRGHQELLADLPKLRVALTEVAQKMRDVAKPSGIFAGTELL